MGHREDRKPTEVYPVPAVRVIVRNSLGKVLLLRRREDSTGGGGWCLPGGKVDYGETLEESVIRELGEETSLECTSPQFLFYQDSLPPAPQQMHCINLYFECTAAGEIALGDESVEYAWMGPEDLDRYDIVFRNEEGLRRYWNSLE